MAVTKPSKVILGTMAISKNKRATKTYPKKKNETKTEMMIHGRASPYTRRMAIFLKTKYKPTRRMTDPAMTI